MGRLTIYLPQLQWNGPQIAQKTYAADIAFGPETSNEQVYLQTIVAHDVSGCVLLVTKRRTYGLLCYRWSRSPSMAVLHVFSRTARLVSRLALHMNVTTEQYWAHREWQDLHYDLTGTAARARSLFAGRTRRKPHRAGATQSL